MEQGREASVNSCCPQSFVKQVYGIRNMKASLHWLGELVSPPMVLASDGNKIHPILLLPVPML